MEPISNIDRLVMVLRQRMLERAKSAGTQNKDARRADGKPQPVDGLAGLALESVDEPQLRRALIQNILVDQFGDHLINDTHFQQVVERVTEALSEDENGAALLDRLLAEFRKTAG